ncbi:MULTISPECIES: TetR/AcrR family transcriptional regulator [unclassified Saccharopolyspora]|uniref:TetR/AcrR family transcriptional regulator n=1 Tax=unclassified Saccharopolyspora TaxID=2646250 RepID=UPI001CD2FDE7|nr:MULTISPECIES: TetR family transcriptional regulator [unclassified Saccharopolyspora]MCA1188443.1 TetR family transcriptional regulator [Saccharopolyspora sp. 6T]MCA1192769.1 TetR family transcriptional regulator [Saccharopolyspora sp. 6V]MCA1279467.1 TetR family transcriptional regulator [Saccharopolyspora sp. 7B]
MAAPRSRNAEQTRAELLAAARARFAADGYERTTLRAVAADVGIDPALVIRYFGGKQELFAAAADFTLDLPDLAGLAPDELAGALLPRFFAEWDRDGTFLALLRAATTSPTAAEKMREVFTAQVAPRLTAIAPDHPRQRAGLLGVFVIGLATSRYVLADPGVAEMGHEELTAWAAPIVRHVLTGPAPVG